MHRVRSRVALAAILLAAAGSVRGQELKVPEDKIPGDKPGTMMSRYWLQQAEQAFQRWRETYEGLKTPQQIAAYQKRLQEKFVESIGGFPERTPLRPQVTGTVQRDGYRVEKVIFESQPQHFVTALLFLPERKTFRPPYPGVIVPCGHSQTGKGHDTYQSVGAFLALSGMAALVFDPIDQGERGQYLGEGGWPKLWGTRAHSLLNVSSSLLGRSTARFEIWDGMRAIDYLQSRPEVDATRIGCTGNSGGGTQTSYLMALDDRIQAAAPSCYLCGFPALLKTIGPQDAEQNIFGQLAFGMDHADYLLMRAPTPILMCTATRDFFDIRGAWEVFRYAKRLYTRMGFSERVSLLENDEGHNYNTLQREGAVRWLARWLLHTDQPIKEPPLQLLSEKERQCTPEGQVMRLPGARSVYDLNRDLEKELSRQRAALWAGGDRGELLAKVRQLAGIRNLQLVPEPGVEKLGSLERPGCRVERLLFKPEEGIVLPALLWLPEKPQAKRALLYVHEEGKVADAESTLDGLVREGVTVLAVDLPGTGQTRAASEFKDVFMAYLLGRSYVGVRAENVLACARWVRELVRDGDGVELVAVGHVGIPALHAAALEPDLFQSARLVRTLRSWSAVIAAPITQVQQSHVVYGALHAYDLPDLAQTLGRKLTLEQPVESAP